MTFGIRSKVSIDLNDWLIYFLYLVAILIALDNKPKVSLYFSISSLCHCNIGALGHSIRLKVSLELSEKFIFTIPWCNIGDLGQKDKGQSRPHWVYLHYTIAIFVTLGNVLTSVRNLSSLYHDAILVILDNKLKVSLDLSEEFIFTIPLQYWWPWTTS